MVNYIAEGLYDFCKTEAVNEVNCIVGMEVKLPVA